MGKLGQIVEKALWAYKEFMDIIDRGDQIREVDSRFPSKAHYIKMMHDFFAALDLRVLN